MKKPATILCALLLFSNAAQAQISINSDFPILLNFNNLNTNFGGAYDSVGGVSGFPTATPGANPAIYSGATKPAVASSYNDYVPGGTYSNTGTYSNANSMRALQDGSSADFALGLKDSTDRNFTIALQNNTTTGIAVWNIGYAVEQYSTGASATVFSLSYSIDGTSFITTDQTGAAPVIAQTTGGGGSDGNLGSVLSTQRTGTVTEAVAPRA